MATIHWIHVDHASDLEYIKNSENGVTTTQLTQQLNLTYTLEYFELDINLKITSTRSLKEDKSF